MKAFARSTGLHRQNPRCLCEGASWLRSRASMCWVSRPQSNRPIQSMTKFHPENNLNGTDAYFKLCDFLPFFLLLYRLRGTCGGMFASLSLSLRENDTSKVRCLPTALPSLLDNPEVSELTLGILAALACEARNSSVQFEPSLIDRSVMVLQSSLPSHLSLW